MVLAISRTTFTVPVSPSIPYGNYNHALSLPCDLLLRHFESMQEPFICHDLLPCVPKCVQRFFHILGIVVFVVGQLAEEHLIDKAVPGLVLCNGGFPFFFEPAEGITDKPRISSQIETACISKPVNFVEVFLRVKAFIISRNCCSPNA